MTSSPSRLYLPDTNILVHYGRESPLYRRIEEQYPLAPTDPQPLLSVITRGEILAFADRNHWGETRRQRSDKFVAQCKVLPLEHPGIIEAYSELDMYSRSKGRTMGDNDLWIAATARATGATLLTTDKDFDHLHPKLISREWIDPNTS